MGSSDLAVRHAPTTAAEAAAASLAAQLGSEVATVLSSALERVTALARTGQIDRAGLRALRDEIDHARRLGMMGQQLERYAGGALTLAPEALDLSSLLRDALVQRAHEMERRGVEVRQVLRPAVVLIDATLGFSLLQCLLDWAFQHARSRIDLEIDRKPWPAHARITCGFAHVPADEAPPATAEVHAAALDTIAWRVLEQTARTLELPLEREDRGGRTRLVIEFPATVAEVVQAAPDFALTEPGEQQAPLAGVHVLVVAARREVRGLVREALRPHAPMLDFVTSVDEAREFCRGAPPQALVHETTLGGENFERLRRELLADSAGVAFVQIAEDEKAFELRQVGAHTVASVGRAAIMEALAQALMFALARSR